MSEEGNVTIESAVHMAVCQSIDLDFDEIEEREKFVLTMIQEAVSEALERAKPIATDNLVKRERELPYYMEANQRAVDDYHTNLLSELGLDK